MAHVALARKRRKASRPTVLFSDDFETGTIAAWDTDNSVATGLHSPTALDGDWCILLEAADYLTSGAIAGLPVAGDDKIASVRYAFLPGAHATALTCSVQFENDAGDSSICGIEHDTQNSRARAYLSAPASGQPATNGAWATLGGPRCVIEGVYTLIGTEATMTLYADGVEVGQAQFDHAAWTNPENQVARLTLYGGPVPDTYSELDNISVADGVQGV